MMEIPVLNVLILLWVKTNISPAHPLKISRIPYPKKKCHFPNPTFQALLLWVLGSENTYINTPANGPEPTLRKGITVILPDKFWGKCHILVPSVWIVYKLTCVFSFSQKKTSRKKGHKCQRVQSKKKSKTSERSGNVCAPKKKTASCVCRPQAVGEGDERVISLQSRIALVDQFANAPQLGTLGCGWILLLPLTADGRGYRMVTDVRISSSDFLFGGGHVTKDKFWCGNVFYFNCKAIPRHTEYYPKIWKRGGINRMFRFHCDNF